MRILSLVLTLAFITTVFSPSTPAPAALGITMIGQGFVGGSELDKSGLTGVICQQGAPANVFRRRFLVALDRTLLTPDTTTYSLPRLIVVRLMV